MRSIQQMTTKNIQCVFTDIDDTLTTDGKLTAEAYQALWKLQNKGIKVVPVTGRPAGWCDMIARFWPVTAVIGENGAFYFSYDEKSKHMKRVWAYDEKVREGYLKKLEVIKNEILKSVPGCAVSADQFSRLFDLAIDFCEDVSPLSKTDIQKIVDIFHKHGAQAKVSSIHVNGWFGAHNKLSMAKIFCEQELKINLEKENSICAFAGDSPNDEPMFEFFQNSVGVANVRDFEKEITHLPKFITSKKSGEGFCELVEVLMNEK